MSFLNDLKEIALKPEVITLLASIFVAAITWSLNERSKRRHNDYIRKEKRYLALIDSLRGFYKGSENTEQKEEFLRQINQSWLYCPDRVIKKGYVFLGTMKAGTNYSDKAKEKALQEFIFEVRKDLLPKRLFIFKRTKLEPRDFEVITSN